MNIDELHKVLTLHRPKDVTLIKIDKYIRIYKRISNIEGRSCDIELIGGRPILDTTLSYMRYFTWLKDIFDFTPILGTSLVHVKYRLKLKENQDEH